MLRPEGQAGHDLPREMPTRVIDVGDAYHSPHLYETRGARSAFVALSHRWGTKHDGYKSLTTTSANFHAHCHGIPLESLPKTFRDAVLITRELGLRFIWIDSLCIIQNSNEDWDFEASRMAQVYNNAYLTLAADLAPHSNVGLFVGTSGGQVQGPPVRQFSLVDETGHSRRIFVRRNWPVPGQTRAREEGSGAPQTGYLTANVHRLLTRIKLLAFQPRLRGKREDSPERTDTLAKCCYASEASSQLKQRGWVLQEHLLSRRTVLFTNAELVWECRDRHVCSCGHTVQATYARDICQTLAAQPAVPTHVAGCGTLATPADPDRIMLRTWHRIVQDFTSRELTYSRDTLPALSGLARKMPYPASDYLAGLWRATLASDLIWLNPTAHLKWQCDDAGRVPDLLDAQGSNGPPTQRLPDRYGPTWSWASVSAPVTYDLGGSLGPELKSEWEVQGVWCSPATGNPYGPVLKNAWVGIEGYVIPVSLDYLVFTTTTRGGDKHLETGTEICVVRKDKMFPGRNKTWMDAGVGGREWLVGSRTCAVQVIGIYKEIPIGIIIVKGTQGSFLGKGEGYERIGMVRLNNWKGLEWRVGGEQRVIRLY